MLKAFTPLLKRISIALPLLGLVFISSQCSWFRVKQTRRVPISERALPAKTANKADLIRLLNRHAQNLQTLNLTVIFELTGGSADTEAISKYRETDGFILMRNPSQIRIIGQAFKVTVFNMVSDGREFFISIPPKNKFIHGLNDQKIEPRKDLPVNLRPQHIYQALAVQPVASQDQPVLLEEDQEGQRKYYILNILDKSGENLQRKVWFDRLDLSIVRQKMFGDHGQVQSDITYGNHKKFDGVVYPSEVNFRRPQEDYSLRIRVRKAKINETLTDAQFVLEKPQNAEWVELANHPTSL